MKLRLLTVVIIASCCVPLKAQTITNYTTTEGLPSNNVLCLTADAANNMWFGTQSGVSKFDGTSWTTFNTATNTEIPDNAITAIASAGSKIWIGTDFGAAVYDGTNWTKFTTTDGLGSNRIQNIFVAKNGDIWFSDFKGATKYNGATFSTFSTSDGLPFGGVQDIDEASNGDILMASGLGGLFVYNGDSLKAYTKAEGLVSNSTTALAIAQNGDVWVGTGDGVTVLDAGYNKIVNYTKMYLMPPPDTLNPVEDIQIDSRGNVWVGVYVDYLVDVGGVAMYNGTTWANFDKDDGLAGPTIRKMALDKNNNVWVGTSTGVSKIESPYLSVAEVSKSDFVMYPNPSNGTINIAFENLDNDIQRLEIYSATGQLLRTVEIQNSSLKQIDLSNLGSGIYYLRAGGMSKKLILN